MEEIADRTEVVLLDDLKPASLLSLSNMIHTSPNGFESGLIRSAITSSVVTATVTATNTTAATTTAAAANTTATGSTTATDSTTLTTTSPTELRLKNRLQRIIKIPPSVAQTHSNKATASTSTHTPPSSATSPNTTTTSPTTNTTTSPTATTPKHRGGHSRVEKKQLVGATVAIGQDKPLVTTTTVTSRLVGSGTDLSAPPSTPSPAPAAPTPVSDSYPDSYLSEKNLETIKVVDQHHLHNPYYYSPDPMPQRQVYTVGSSLLAKAKVKARALQHNLLSPQQQQQHQQHSIQQQHQQKQHELDPPTKLELHKGNQEEGADGRGSSSDGTDVESNASNSNSNTISVGTSNHLKSIHYQHRRLHHRSSSAQLDSAIMGDSDPQSDNSHDHSNDSDSTVTDHPPHEALLSPPTPRSRKCSLRSRNSISPDEEKLSSACIAVAGGGGGGGGATALLTTTPAVLPRSLSKETAAGVEEKDDEDSAVVFAEEKKADTIGEALLLSDSPEPTMLMTTQDSAALYEVIFQRQHLTEEAISGSLHELRQLILAYGIPEQPTMPKAKPNKPTIRSKCWKLLLEVHHVSAQEYISLVKQGKPQEYSKIRNDTFRTLATDRKFLDVVEEDSLIRVLCAFAWSTQATSVQDTDVSFTYVQGMNVLAAPFLYTMTEMEAFYSYSNFIKNCCPLYVQPTLQGVHCGIKLLEECLCKIDVQLYDYLKSKRLSAELYAFPSVLTICACTPPLDQVMKLWDFLLAWGIHLNIICIIAQLHLIRDELMSHASPMKLLRIFPDLDADKVIRETIRMVKLLPDELYDLLVRHPYDPTVAEKIGW